jgi:hypothetical protein
MGLIGGLWMFVLGVLGAANLIIARKPDAKELIGKLAPYQGWIGAVSCLWGIWMIISSLLSIGWIGLGFTWMIYWVTYLAVAVVQAALGFLLGIGVLKTFIKKPDAVEKMDQLVTKLAPYQGILGLIGMGLGLWLIIGGFILI